MYIMPLGEVNSQNFVVMNRKVILFPSKFKFCRLRYTDRLCLSQIFHASTTQTTLPSVTVNPRLHLTEQRSEMKQGVLGSVPNDPPQHSATAPLPQ